MGRRLRHFNPVHAGAVAVLDARFLDGYANGDSVTSWPSRPGTAFTFSGASNYPTFSTSVAAAGNQPGVSFNAGSQQRLTNAGAPIPAGSNTFTHVEFSTGGSNFITFTQYNNLTIIGAHGTGSAPAWNIVYVRGYFEWVNTSNTRQILNTGGTQANGLPTWMRQNGTAQAMGTRFTTTLSRTSSGALRSTNSPGITNFRTGVHHAHSTFPIALSDSMLRRILDHYAFSFKNSI